MKIALALALLLGACAGDLGPSGDDCTLTLSSTPMTPVAGPTTEIRINSVATNDPGTHTYTWHVSKNGVDVAFAYAQTDRSAITFIAPDPGTYDIDADLSPSLAGACSAHAIVNVVMDATFEKMRLHIVPPLTAMGPIVDRPIEVHDGSDLDIGAVVLDASTQAAGTVRNASGAGIPAYVQFYPLGMPGAMVETFANSAGAFSVRLASQPHDVIVIPAATNVAPQRLAGYSPGSTLAMLTAPDTITGTVHQGASPIANARVQLTIDGVPTTLGITAANGS